jgi:chromosome segregation ATPase
MRELKVALEQAPNKVNAVSASLQGIARDGVDMKAAFAQFSRDVDALSSHREHVRSLGSEVKASKAAFSGAWQARLATIHDADLRQRSAERRDTVLAKFGDLSSSVDTAKASFEPWMQKVVDLRTYLESDLNTSGVDHARDKIDEVSSEAESVNQSLAEVVDRLESMSQEIEAAKPPAGDN